VCDLETSKEEAKGPLKGCEYKPTMGCDAERKKNIGYIVKTTVVIDGLLSLIVHITAGYLILKNDN
jgi:hypothetical protein